MIKIQFWTSTFLLWKPQCLCYWGYPAILQNSCRELLNSPVKGGYLWTEINEGRRVPDSFSSNHLRTNEAEAKLPLSLSPNLGNTLTISHGPKQRCSKSLYFHLVVVVKYFSWTTLVACCVHVPEIWVWHFGTQCVISFRDNLVPVGVGKCTFHKVYHSIWSLPRAVCISGLARAADGEERGNTMLKKSWHRLPTVIHVWLIHLEKTVKSS